LSISDVGIPPLKPLREGGEAESEAVAVGELEEADQD